MKIKNLHIRNINISSKELLYLLTYGVYSGIDIVDRSLINIHTILRIMMLGTIAITSLLFLLNPKFTLKRLAALTAVLGVFSLAAIITNRTNMILYGMLILTADVTSFNKIVKTSLCASFPAMLFVIACSQIGIVPDYKFKHEGMVAHGLGFSYFSSAAYIFMFIMISYMYLRGKKITLIELAGLALCNCFIYKVTTVRLTFFIFLAVIILFLLFVKWDLIPNFNKGFFRKISVLAFPSAFVFTIWCALNFTMRNRWWREIDGALNGRLYLSNKAFSMYSLKLFGQYIEMNGNAYGNSQAYYFYIDSGYVYSFLANGIIFTLVLLAVYSYLMWFACRSNNKPLLVWIVSILFFTIINNVWSVITYNPLLLCFAIAISGAIKQPIMRFTRFS